MVMIQKCGLKVKVNGNFQRTLARDLICLTEAFGLDVPCCDFQQLIQSLDAAGMEE